MNDIDYLLESDDSFNDLLRAWQDGAELLMGDSGSELDEEHVAAAAAAYAEEDELLLGSPVRKTRDILANRYPGDVLECMSQVVPPINAPQFPENKLWIRQPEIENEQYYRHFRMPKAAFNHLVSLVSPCIDRPNRTTPIIPAHKVYSHRDIVAMTLYHLGHAATFQQMQSIFGRPDATIRVLVREGVAAMEKALVDGVFGHGQIRFPMTEEERRKVIASFSEFIHGMPQCCGTIDGTLVSMKKPSATQVCHTCTLPHLRYFVRYAAVVVMQEPLDNQAYYSYKSKIAMLLLAIVDARGRFMWANAGSPGCMGDAGVWQRDEFRSILIEQQGLLDTPRMRLSNPANPKEPVREVTPFFVGDGAFRFTRYMMKCYPEADEKRSRIKAVWNRVLCDTRKVVECAFGQLKMRWQFCLNNAWQNEPEYVRACVLVCCALHNYCVNCRVNYDEAVLAQVIRNARAEEQRAADAPVGAAAPRGGVGHDAPEAIRSWMASYVAFQEYMQGR